MDIQLADGNSFDIFDQISIKAPIIFTTAYDEYAIKAIKAQAIDYLLKPVDIDDLTIAIEKVRNQIENNNLISDKLERILENYSKQVSDKKITVNTDGKLIFLNISDIVFAESDGNYSTFYLSNSKKILLTKKLKEVNQILPDNHFFRIHNSYIVNLDKINEYVKSDGYVVLEGNHKIPISRMKRKEFLNKI